MTIPNSKVWNLLTCQLLYAPSPLPTHRTHPIYTSSKFSLKPSMGANASFTERIQSKILSDLLLLAMSK
jgi:hypothetical protein